MAGHSQFKNIMHRKGAQDKKRAKLFNKLGREITVAARSGLPDPDANARLRNAIIAARKESMPNDRIKNAIALGSPNSADLSNYEEVRYEGYGLGGVAVIVEALTDNRNRTAAEIRSAFTKNDGALGESNSVSFMFARIGQIVYPAAAMPFDALFDAAIEAGADNVDTVNGMHEVTTRIEDFLTARDFLEEKFGEPQSAAILWKPNVMAPLDQEQAQSLLDLVEALEDDDDVQNVYTNADIAEEIMEKLAAG